jgi:RNA-directed DNA polymerase
MVAKRPKEQRWLPFEGGPEGEAGGKTERRVEATIADQPDESPTLTEQLMEEVCERENLKRALKRVKANKGSPGVDGMKVEELPEYLKEHWPAIKQQLLRGSYKPQAVKRVEIPKPGGGVRKLGIPTAVDRFIQQAVMQVLQRRWDATFSDHSYGFRPGRTAHQAVARAQGYIAEGNGIVVDIDLEKFFDRVNHDVLMSRVARRITDKRVLRLIRAFLTAGIMENGLVSPSDEGTPQGGPLSPILSNLLLDDLDKELEQRGHRFVRYADDCNVYVKSERAGNRVMESIERYLTRKLKLRVNREKSAVGNPKDRKFLGFSFLGQTEPRRMISAKSVKQFKRRVREITGRTRGIKLERMIEELSPYLRGWIGYYGYSQMPSDLRALDSWIRRRLRSMMWKQWQRSSARYQELRRRGVPQSLAHGITCLKVGPWAASLSRAMSTAFPVSYFRSLGLPELTAYQKG